MSSPGTPKASPAAVAAVQEALGCEEYEFWADHHIYCRLHDREWTERGCPVAVAAADAAAPHNAATAWDDGYPGSTCTHIRRHPAKEEP